MHKLFLLRPLIKKMFVFAAVFVGVIAIRSSSHQAGALAQSGPFLVCGRAGVECSYILWDGHGSVGFVVPGGNMNFPISSQYRGFKFCMHAAVPRAPMPSWPGCHDPSHRKPWTWDNTYGEINNGKNG